MAKRRTRKSILKTIGIAGGIVFGVIVLLYIIGIFYFRNHFAFGTKINGVNCSLKSVAGAENKITDVVQNFEITVKERDGKTESINGKDINMDVVFDDSLADLVKKQSTVGWILHIGDSQEINSKVSVSYDRNKLDQIVNKLECMDPGKMKKPVDAFITYNGEKKEYEVNKEKVGTQVDTAVMLQKVQESVEGLCDTLDMVKEGCYVAPEYTADSDAVKSAVETANTYVNTQVTYDYTTDQVVVASEEISQWIQFDKNMKVTFDKAKVQEFVSNMAAKHDTIFTERTFHTSYKKDITISNGDYGWWTNRVAERKDLINFIKKGQSGTKEPVYYQKAVQRGADDIGDTYVEVNITRQHVLLYKDGKLIDEADCVSGRNSSPTPEGIFSVTYKDHTYEGHQVQLKGENYASDVDFFIPFYGNVGLHDASWRKSFGGSQYKNGGSHGCVNLPYHMAESIYNNVEKGMPVIVYEE